MESFSVEPASRSAVSPHAGEETPTWLSVDLRFVIAAVVLLGAVAATTIRFSHEVFDPLADYYTHHHLAEIFGLLLVHSVLMRNIARAKKLFACFIYWSVVINIKYL